MSKNPPYRIMISGGGTGGHVFPAISIGQALKEILSEVDILFVGAKGKIEMTKVPDAGFDIVGMWISGLQRRLTISNLIFPIKLVVSLVHAYRLITKFKPDVVVGVGGYASGPLLYVASIRKIPTLIQEQNSYAGLTNKLLASNVNTVCVAHEGMETYFPKEKIIVTGNPVRSNLELPESQKDQAFDFFKLDKGRPTLLVIGGSLGARTINESISKGIDQILEQGVQLIWQTGKFYFDDLKDRHGHQLEAGVYMSDFINQMKYAYGIADVVISRAGALSIAELMVTGKASILVPSPNVAEDHQTKNAKALEEREAAVTIRDSSAEQELVNKALQLLQDKVLQESLKENISAMAKPDAARTIANKVIELIA